jgi:Uma2 family endonuclease
MSTGNIDLSKKPIIMPSRAQPKLAPDEYLAMERQAETKSEYFNGEVYAMTVATRAHNIITTNVTTALVTQLKGRRCEVYASDMRVKVQPTGLYTYPDVAVVCGKVQLEDRRQDTLLNPTVLVEVFSPSTEDYDRGTKFAHYRALESLLDYFVIAQAEVRVEHYQRQPDDKWLLTTYTALDAVVAVSSLGCDLLLTEVYHKVEWPEADSQSYKLHRVKEVAEPYADSPR